MTNAAGHRPPLGLPVPAQVTHESGTIHGVSVSEETWYSVHDALPAGSYIGRPSYHDERREWVMYAYDPPSGRMSACGAGNGPRWRSPRKQSWRRWRGLRELGRGRAPK